MQGPQRVDAWTAAAGQAARWIGLELDLRAPRTWFGPSWAFLGGVLSSGRAALGMHSLVLLVLAWLVIEPLLGSLLALAMQVARWRAERRPEVVIPHRWKIPYARPGSPGQRALDALAAWLARCGQDWLAIEGAGERGLFLAVVALALSLAVGGQVALLVALALLALVAVAAGRPLRAEGQAAVAAGHFLVSWLVGRSAFLDLDRWALLVGLGFAVIWYAWTLRPPRAWPLAATYAFLAALLVGLHAPLPAAGMLLLAGPVFALWPEGPTSQRTYLQNTQIYLMLSLLLVAWGLTWGF